MDKLNNKHWEISVSRFCDPPLASSLKPVLHIQKTAHHLKKLQEKLAAQVKCLQETQRQLQDNTKSLQAEVVKIEVVLKEFQEFWKKFF